MRKYLEHLACLTLLLLLAVALSWACLSGAALPLDLSVAMSLGPWLTEAAPTPDPLSWTHLYKTYPAYLHMAAVGAGEASLTWNPVDGLGAPFLAQWHTRALSPFSLPVYWLGLPLGLGVSLLLKLFVAALTTYYCARRFGYHAPIAFAMAAMFLLSAPMHLWAGEPLGDALPWLPLLFLAGERLALGLPYAWVTGGFALAMIALAGHPPALSGGMLLLPAYVSLRSSGHATKVVFDRFYHVLVTLGIGLLCAGAQVWPYLEYLGQVENEGLAIQAVGSLAWQGLFHPAADGGRATALLFTGFLAPLLLPLWWLLRRYMEPALRTRTAVMLIIGFGGLLIGSLLGGTLSSPNFAPWLDGTIFLFPAALALIFVTGAVAEEWVLLGAEETQEALPRLRTVLPAFWLPYLALSLGVGLVAGLPWMALLPVFVATLIVFILFAYTLVRPGMKAMAAGLTIVAAFTLSVYPARPQTDASRPLPPSPFLDNLVGEDFSRIAGSGALEQWPLGMFGMQQCFAPNPASLKRLAAFQQAAADSPMLLRRTGAAGLLLTKEDIQGAMSDIRPTLKVKSVFEQGAILFEDSAMDARARVIYAGRKAATPGEAPGDAQDLPVMEGATLPEDAAMPPMPATITFESPTEVRVNVPDGPPGVLVLSDQWYPGWNATVDGQHVPVVPIDAAFRGIEISEGPHDVLFKYDPASLRYGLLISAAGALILLLGIWRSLLNG
ncbi:MAG: hypothetical protein RLZZ303_1856 [Candidatus Hydrogenedentota bacterium]